MNDRKYIAFTLLKTKTEKKERFGISNVCTNA